MRRFNSVASEYLTSDIDWFRALDRFAQTPGKPAPFLAMAIGAGPVTKQCAKSQRKCAQVLDAGYGRRVKVQRSSDEADMAALEARKQLPPGVLIDFVDVYTVQELNFPELFPHGLRPHVMRLAGSGAAFGNWCGFGGVHSGPRYVCSVTSPVSEAADALDIAHRWEPDGPISPKSGRRPSHSPFRAMA